MNMIEAPGGLTDFTEDQAKDWSDLISRFIDRNISDYGLTQFFNPTKTEIGGDAAEKKIDWSAFPKVVEIASGGSDVLRWSTADGNRLLRQDEYCEWHVTRNDAGKIEKVEFTSEGPEYWSFLFDQDPEKVLAHYHKYVDPSVVIADVVDGNGAYNPSNRWNDPKRGGKLAHLGHVNNTLGAFVNIGARSTIIRQRPDGTIMTGETELIDCGLYGGRDRHSDPHIGGEVNALARVGANITMANPVGLSMDGLFPLNWEVPDGSDPRDFWHVDRGIVAHQMRTRYEVPADRGFVVGDIKINGREIQFGAQITDFIRVKLVGIAHEFGKHLAAPRACEDVAGMMRAGGPAPLPAGSTVPASERMLSMLSAATR
ncbi:hypothetical protein VQ045_20285 [Aurantimonas sp. E1-2-R+4]|uniref:hypothetical protein n=1 Tax=Aurantimonas sp. E1-2-R+4 TaxID=3113714 RepID=UPI002F92570D